MGSSAPVWIFVWLGDANSCILAATLAGTNQNGRQRELPAVLVSYSAVCFRESKPADLPVTTTTVAATPCVSAATVESAPASAVESVAAAVGPAVTAGCAAAVKARPRAASTGKATSAGETASAFKSASTNETAAVESTSRKAAPANKAAAAEAAPEETRTAEPRTGPDEDSARKPTGPVKSVGRACVRGVVIVAISANRRSVSIPVAISRATDAYANADLRL